MRAQELRGVFRSVKSVYFVQVNYLYGNTAYLPYAVGSLAAYAWQNETICREYALGRFVFVREPIDEVAASLENPFLVGFSSYIWNFEYNKALAKAIKEKHPDCVIVFGGHQIPFDSSALLESEPYIDYLVHEEGEEAFASLLLFLAGEGAAADIANLSYRDANGAIRKNENAKMVRSDYPSPYLCGLFDALFDQYDYEFSATLETNRGCPFHCAFCDWGTLRGKLRQFPIERVQAEIAWMAQKKIDHVYCADANYGIFPRDRDIVDTLIESKQRTGFPRKFRVCYTKNSDVTVFELNQKLDASDMSKGATLSFQSVCPAVLEYIGRKNLTLERFRELMTLYNAAGIPSNSELILGLPGESYESFCAGIGQLLEAGQHSSLNIYNCEMLPNAKMADAAYQALHGIQTVTTLLGRNHCDSAEEEEVAELSEIICETADMSRSQWKKANLFALLVQSYHCLGLLQNVAIYLFYEKNISFEQVYDRLLQWVEAKPESVAGAIFADISKRLDTILEGYGTWSYVNPMFGNIIWPFEEGMFLETLLQFVRFYEEIPDFLRQFDLDETLLADLLRYQQLVVKIPNKHPLRGAFAYDWSRYFSQILCGRHEPLAKLRNTIQIHEEAPMDNWPDYAREIVWYGRKGSKNIYTKMDVTYD